MHLKKQRDILKTTVIKREADNMSRNKEAFSGPVPVTRHVISVECLSFKINATTSIQYTTEETVFRGALCG